MAPHESMTEVWACNSDGNECLHQAAFFWDADEARDFVESLRANGKRAECFDSGARIAGADAAVGELGGLSEPAV